MIGFLKHKWIGLVLLVGFAAGIAYSMLETEVIKMRLTFTMAMVSGVGAISQLFSKRKWRKKFIHKDWDLNFYFPTLIIPPNSHYCGRNVEVEMSPDQFKTNIYDCGTVTILRHNKTMNEPYDPLYVTIRSRSKNN